MELFDTHAHLFLEGTRQYDQDPVEILKSAQTSGVANIVLIGTNNDDNKKNLEFGKKHQGVWVSVGIHPTNIKSAQKDLIELEKLLSQPKVIAIGEVGFDLDKNDHLDLQKEFLKGIFQLSCQYKLPVIIHIKDLFEELFDLVQSEKPYKFVTHCFNGNYAQAKKILQLGGMISFTNMLEYPKNSSLREIVKQIPLEKIMLETDAPFLPPQIRRGTICQPQDVIYVAKAIAELKNLPVVKVAEITSQNSKNFFNI